MRDFVYSRNATQVTFLSHILTILRGCYIYICRDVRRPKYETASGVLADVQSLSVQLNKRYSFHLKVRDNGSLRQRFYYGASRVGPTRGASQMKLYRLVSTPPGGTHGIRQ